MKIDSFVADHNVPFTHTDEVITLIKENFPAVKEIKVEVVNGKPSKEYPNANCNYLMGIKVFSYFENTIVGRNINGDRICISGIKFYLCERVDKDGIHQYSMNISGIGRYFPCGCSDLSIIEVRDSRRNFYGSYQYNTNLEDLCWEQINRFFATFTTLQKTTKGQLKKIVESFENYRFSDFYGKSFTLSLDEIAKRA